MVLIICPIIELTRFRIHQCIDAGNHICVPDNLTTSIDFITDTGASGLQGAKLGDCSLSVEKSTSVCAIEQFPDNPPAIVDATCGALYVPTNGRDTTTGPHGRYPKPGSRVGHEADCNTGII